MLEGRNTANHIGTQCVELLTVMMREETGQVEKINQCCTFHTATRVRTMN